MASSIDVGAVHVDARGVGVRCGVVAVALAVSVVEACAAVGWSEVAVAIIRVSVAVHPLTRARIVHQRPTQTTQSTRNRHAYIPTATTHL